MEKIFKRIVSSLPACFSPVAEKYIKRFGLSDGYYFLLAFNGHDEQHYVQRYKLCGEGFVLSYNKSFGSYLEALKKFTELDEYSYE